MNKYELIAQELEATGQYRVLRKVEERVPIKRDILENEKIALIVDTETTGLNLERDEAIEIAILAFTYDEEGKVGDLIGKFESLREPSIALSSQVTEITGLTPDLVKGHRIDKIGLESFVEKAGLVIAHNAAFDRPICEKISDIFTNKPWACTATEINWQKFGFDGAKLSYLLNQSGFFYSAHRAAADCYALLELLAKPLPQSTDTALQHLLTSARQTRYRVTVVSSYEQRTLLRARGYKWNYQNRSRSRGWWLELSESEKDAEIAFLQAQAKIAARDITIERLTALERFRLQN